MSGFRIDMLRHAEPVYHVRRSLDSRGVRTLSTSCSKNGAAELKGCGPVKLMTEFSKKNWKRQSLISYWRSSVKQDGLADEWLGIRFRDSLLPPPRLCFHLWLSVNRITQILLLIKYLWNVTEWLDIIHGPIEILRNLDAMSGSLKRSKLFLGE